MTITAAKLGSSPLRADWTSIGHTQVAAPQLESAWCKLKARFESSEIGFYQSPISNEISAHQESAALAKTLLDSRQFTDALFLGIGGSSLGPMSLLSSLQDLTTSGLKIHYLENPDPNDWLSTIKKLNPNTTLVVAVTKSGTTFETIAQLLLAMDWLGPDRMKKQIVAVTDPGKGDLRAFATHNNLMSLPISANIGGRFSIFTSVGLFPAALAGLNTTEFLKGASQVRDYCEKTPSEKNSLFLIAQGLLAQAQKKPIHVCMPYSSRLRMIGDWFVQLWGESLGKNGKGFTPVGALGAIDQHSILQLLRDGPNDKVTCFITVDKSVDPVKIPDVMKSYKFGQYGSFTQLQGHTLHDLLKIEYEATALVLTKQNRPHLTFQIDELSERSLGALYFAFAILTSITGTLMDVNPFDQPGVEEAKVYIREALHRNQRERDAQNDSNSPVNRLRRSE